MADASGQQDIAGLDIQKTALGFSDEGFIFKKFCNLVSTSARLIRWYQKSTGTLAVTAPSNLDNVDDGALPSVLEQSWTRKSDNVRKYFISSPILSMEDIKDTDIDILATNVRDLVRAIEKQVDSRIYNIMTESQTPVDINTTASTAAWDAASGVNIIKDILVGKRKIRENAYNPEGAVLLLSAKDHESLMVYLIDTKGSSIPAFASQKIGSGVVMELLGLQVVVSENVVADSAAIVVSQRACTFKQFVGLTTAVIDHPGIGKEIRIWEEGEALLTDPKAVHLTTNTQT